MRTTKSFSTREVERRWYVVDVSGIPIGRAASRIAAVLRGKTKPQFTYHSDTGDFVIVVNAAEAVLTGRKSQNEKYRWHTGYPGHLRERTRGELLADKPEFLFRKVVKGMLPRGPLGRAMLRKLKVYAGPSHRHEAQQPQPLDIKSV